MERIGRDGKREEELEKFVEDLCSAGSRKVNNKYYQIVSLHTEQYSGSSTKSCHYTQNSIVCA